MKIRNKKTGEIRKITSILIDKMFTVNSLAELNEEWEDYEEPKDKGYWYMDDLGRIQFSSEVLDELEDHPNNLMIRKLYGNYFETREEAEKAVEKLRTWKHLKDKGFRFDGYDVAHNSNGDLCGQLFYNAGKYHIVDVEKDLDLLFGGKLIERGCNR